MSFLRFSVGVIVRLACTIFMALLIYDMYLSHLTRVSPEAHTLLVEIQTTLGFKTQAQPIEHTAQVAHKKLPMSSSPQLKKPRSIYL